MELENFGKFRGLPVPYLSPYAIEICKKYKRVYPWFLTVPTTLTNVAREFKQVVTNPLNYDCLICGAHSQISDGDNGQNVLLQVSDLQTGYLWSVPNAILGSPSNAYGGVRSNVMPYLQLPEAFFLPGNVALKHEWKTYGLATGGTLTWFGVALMEKRTDVEPDYVTLPDGNIIKIGTRLPWLNTIGLGEEISIIGNPAYVYGARSLFTGFSDSVDRRVTLTDMVANFFVQGGLSTNPENFKIGFAVKGQAETWSPEKIPVTQFLGDPQTGFPALPLPVPCELLPGDRVQLALLNRNTVAINNAYITMRGIQHGGY